MNLLNIFKTDKSKIKGELTFKVRDKWGRTKQLWQENWLGKLIRKTLGVDLQGISFLGRWTDQLVFNNLVVNAGLPAWPPDATAPAVKRPSPTWQ